MRLLKSLIAVAGAFLWLSAPADAETRVALVIGNGGYDSSVMPELPNPPRDAAAIGQKLTDLGFDVEVMTDATKDETEDALARLAKKARTADITLLFYAGHGIQDQGKNYLAPIDATLTDVTDLKRRFLQLDDVMEYIGEAKGAKIVLLDACRDNGAVDVLKAAAPSRAAGITRGLARIPSSDGELVAFATQPDNVAADGEGANSPFTEALLAHLGEPGLELRTALTRVRADVSAATGGAQRPEVWDSLIGEVILNPAEESAGAAPDSPAAADAPAAGARDVAEPNVSADNLFWDSVRDSTRAEDFQAYLDAFPQGVFAPLARSRLAALETPQPEATPSSRDVAHLPIPRAAAGSCATFAMPAGEDTYCASSVLPSQRGIGYGTGNLYDDDAATAWVPKNLPDSVGQWVSVVFDAPRAVRAILIDNGYQKSADIYRKNSRIKRLDAHLGRHDHQL